MKTQKRVIRVNSCDECPLIGECRAWKNLTSKERVLISIGNSIPVDFMLKDCHLEEVD